MTTQGASGPLDARQQMDTERACLLHGNVRIEAVETNNEALTEIRGGDKAAYKYLDFYNRPRFKCSWCKCCMANI